MATVNSPYRRKIFVDQLVLCLSHIGSAKLFPGHVSSFYLDVSDDAREEFFRNNYVPEAESVAREFFAWAGIKRDHNKN